MERPIQSLFPLINRRFQSFAEATDASLGVLAGSLPGTIAVAQVEPDGTLCRVLDTRGGQRLERGALLPLVNRDAPNGNGDGRHGSLTRVEAEHLEPEALVALGFAESIALPVELSDGHVVGMLCALATKPGVYRADDVVLLGLAARLLGYEWERVRSRAELRELRHRLRDGEPLDPETGLPNRAGFGAQLEREWKLSRRGTVKSSVLACEIRVDGRDSEPDAALSRLAIKDCADVLAGAARTTDHVGRIGDTTLGVVMIGAVDPVGIASFTRRYSQALQRTIRARPFAVALSTGAHPLAEADSAEQALDLAERTAQEWTAERTEAVAGVGEEELA